MTDAAVASDSVWSEADTTPGAIEEALRGLLAERHAEQPSDAPARVLNLVCVVDRQWSGEIANRLRRAGSSRPSRTIVCRVSHGRTKLDAVATISALEPASDEAVPLLRESVIIDMGPHHVVHLDTIIDPLVVTDLPTTVWAPHGHWEAVEALQGLSQTVLLDTAADAVVADSLRRANVLIGNRAVVDLAWLRSAQLRERLASSFDHRREALHEIAAVEVHHSDASGAAALLLCGWLAAQLGWKVEPLGSHAHGRAAGHCGDIELLLEVAPHSTSELRGISVRMRDGSSLSLNRGTGGLLATSRDAEGSERTWTLLGVHRDEAAILGEGIYRSVLGDPVYARALRAAGELLH